MAFLKFTFESNLITVYIDSTSNLSLILPQICEVASPGSRNESLEIKTEILIFDQEIMGKAREQGTEGARR